MSNAINWFEIPAADFDRAVNFYNAILNADLQKMEMGPMNMAFLPAQEPGVGGAVVAGEGLQPAANGTTVYLNGGNDLNDVLGKVEAAGGQVIVQKTQISPEYGFFGLFMDTEGNKVGVHSMN